MTKFTFLSVSLYVYQQYMCDCACVYLQVCVQVPVGVTRRACAVCILERMCVEKHAVCVRRVRDD